MKNAQYLDDKLITGAQIGARSCHECRALSHLDRLTLPCGLARRLRSALVFLVLLGAQSACSSTSTSHTSAGDGGYSIAPPPEQDASTQAATTPIVVLPVAPSEPPCTSPWAPVLESLPTGATLPIFANVADQPMLASDAADAGTPVDWQPATSLELPSVDCQIQVLAKLAAAGCTGATNFSNTYPVQEQFAPAAGKVNSTAIDKDDSQLRAWASTIVDVQYGANVSSAWQTPEKALGPAGDDTTNVVSLGEGGTITVGFDVVLQDGTGYDFAVFENGFSDNYLELAFVEVSSDNVHFARFDAAALTDSPVGPYGTIEPESLQGFAGKYRVGWGTPFDLAWLRWQPSVRAGVVDLTHIISIRVVDIVGDGRVRDSLGHVVYDPYPTTGSAGFDLDAIGLINVADE